MHRGNGADYIGSLYDNASVGLNFVNRANSSGNAVVALSLVNGNATFAGDVTLGNTGGHSYLTMKCADSSQNAEG